jgi:enamine deaminase RidA (YjgF/YER057c/UK114 family)
MPFFDTSYSVIRPFSKGDFLSDWQNCLMQLIALAKDSHYRIFKINIFAHSTDIEDFQAKKKFITDAILNTFGEECPAFAISANSPENQFYIAIEVGRVNSTEIVIEYRKLKDWQYTTIEKHGYKELWANGIGDKSPGLSTKTATGKAFDIMRHILLTERMTFNNIVRQWNYIGGILNTEQHNSRLEQHYQVFNKVRHDYYHRYRSIPGFPAATGVGMNFTGVMIDFCAIAQADGLQVISVKNPRQVNPCSYDQKVLIGPQLQRQKQKEPPLFERAKLLTHNDQWRLFVSGTASIIGQETSGKGDLEEQTTVTIENIEKLTSRENLVLHCPQLICEDPNKYSRIRVYVKNAIDIPLVKSICSKHFGNIPAIYIQSDICRTDLLVEIEADLYS